MAEHPADGGMAKRVPRRTEVAPTRGPSRGTVRPTATGSLISEEPDGPDVSPRPADVAFARRAAYVEPADALVLADLHLGRDRASDVDFPLGERADVFERMGRLLERFAPSEVVVAGDLLHSFAFVPDGVAATVAAVRAAVAEAGASLVVTPGNHDGLVEEVFDGPTPDEHRLTDGTVVCHGHERPTTDGPRYVVAHDHPTLTVEGQRHPCFLHGGTTDGEVLVIPAFSRLARGVTVGAEAEFMSPLLPAGADAFRPIVYDDERAEALAFPPLASLREHL